MKALYIYLNAKFYSAILKSYFPVLISEGTTVPLNRVQPVAEALPKLTSFSKLAVFCHIFNLTKRLTFLTSISINFIPLLL